METTTRFTSNHASRGSALESWWSELLYQPMCQFIDIPIFGSADCHADDEWDRLWMDVGGEG
jgi:hypothetical protein